MKKTKKLTIDWICTNCDYDNCQFTHSDPEAHFASMICDNCEYEIDGCFCDYITIPIRSHYSRMGKKSSLKLTKKERIERATIASHSRKTSTH